MGRNLPVDPVGNVKSPVESQRSQIVGRHSLGLSRSRQHEQLGQNRNALQPNGKGPQDLRGHKLVVEDQGEDGDGRDQVVQTECVQRSVVCRSIPNRLCGQTANHLGLIRPRPTGRFCGHTDIGTS